MLILLGIIVWLLFGVAGVALRRADWYRKFGHYYRCDWTSPTNFWTIPFGPATFGAGLLIYLKYRSK